MHRNIVGVAMSAALALALCACGSSGSTQGTNSGDAGTSDSKEAQQAQESVEQASDFAVTIDAVEKTSDYQGNPAVIVSFTYTNNSDEATSMIASTRVELYQGGVQQDLAVVPDLDTSASYNNVKPGVSVPVQLAYTVNDDSDIDVEVYELISLDKKPLAAQSFTLS